ncbi:putative multi-functional enzyme with acyl-CoA-reductase activity ACRA1 [Mycobacteroides abscessus subsp. abscessus]|nr:putative multi-functional enzyme with acyl-CoA-reductase activity ACRA1 [Mycobacteroides abscessus subsp. abscessus]
MSTAGVQTRNPKYASYIPTKAALDAFADVVATETVSDHITFTNIHMPLVKTPMITPSHKLNVVRGLTPADEGGTPHPRSALVISRTARVSASMAPSR